MPNRTLHTLSAHPSGSCLVGLLDSPQLFIAWRCVCGCPLRPPRRKVRGVQSLGAINSKRGLQSLKQLQQWPIIRVIETIGTIGHKASLSLDSGPFILLSVEAWHSVNPDNP